MQRILTSSSASGEIAIVRQRHREAVRSSNVEQDPRRGGRWRRRVEISFGPKKKERWTMSSSGISVPLVSGTLSYSRCVNVARGGSCALRMCLSQTGGIEGVSAPRAISPTADMNWTRPAASLIVWLSRRAKIKPPHFRRVTYKIVKVQNFLSD